MKFSFTEIFSYFFAVQPNAHTLDERVFLLAHRAMLAFHFSLRISLVFVEIHLVSFCWVFAESFFLERQSTEFSAWEENSGKRESFKGNTREEWVTRRERNIVEHNFSLKLIFCCFHRWRTSFRKWGSQHRHSIGWNVYEASRLSSN